MFVRRVIIRATPVASRTLVRTVNNPSRRLRARGFSWFANARSGNTGKHTALGGVVVGLAVGLGYTYSKAIADDGKTESQKLDWRERIRGNYNNRIREFSTPEKVFNTFASVKQDGKPAFMTLDDLCNAILPFDYRSSHEVTKIAKVPEIFKLADLNGDGLISFGEFVFFTTLLSIPAKHFQVAFEMFDINGDGLMSKGEFKKVMQVMRSQSGFVSKNRDFSGEVANMGGLLRLFFGEDGKKKVTLKEFLSFMNKLHDAMLDLEFSRYENPNQHGTITARNFAMSLVGYAYPHLVSQFIARIEQLDAGLSNAPITREEFFAFNRALEKIDEIALAIRLYAAGEHAFSKKDFMRAVRAVAGVQLSPTQVDVIFHVFDRDGNGKLDYDELLAVMAQRQDRGLNHPRDTGFVRTLNCLKGCFSSQY